MQAITCGFFCGGAITLIFGIYHVEWGAIAMGTLVMIGSGIIGYVDRKQNQNGP